MANLLDPLGIIGATKKDLDRLAVRSGVPRLPNLPGVTNPHSELQVQVTKRALKSTYAWAVYVEGELSDWNSGTLEYCRAQMAVAFNREMVDPRLIREGKSYGGLEIIGELYSIDERGKVAEIPGGMHGIAR